MSRQGMVAGVEIPASVAARERLERRALILSLLEGLREQSGDANLGKSLERLIVRQELCDLEDLDGQAASLKRREFLPGNESVEPVDPTSPANPGGSSVFE